MSDWTQPHGFFSMMSDDSKARRARAPQRYPIKWQYKKNGLVCMSRCHWRCCRMHRGLASDEEIRSAHMYIFPISSAREHPEVLAGALQEPRAPVDR